MLVATSTPASASLCCSWFLCTYMVSMSTAPPSWTPATYSITFSTLTKGTASATTWSWNTSKCTRNSLKTWLSTSISTGPAFWRTYLWECRLLQTWHLTTSRWSMNFPGWLCSWTTSCSATTFLRQLRIEFGLEWSSTPEINPRRSPHKRCG